MMQPLLHAPLVTHLLSPLVFPALAPATEDTGTPPVIPITPGLFTVDFGDGHVDILPQTPMAATDFTVDPGDASLTVIPTQET